MSAQFLMKSGRVAFTTDIETLIVKQTKVVETCLPKYQDKEQKKLSRLLRLRAR